MDLESPFVVSATAAKTSLALSRYVDEVRDASVDVQDLATQVAATHFALCKLKYSIRKSDMKSANEWGAVFNLVLSQCNTALENIGAAVAKAEVTVKQSSDGEELKRVKWQFKDIDKLKKDLRTSQENIQNIIKVVSGVSRSVHYTSVQEVLRTNYLAVLQTNRLSFPSLNLSDAPDMIQRKTPLVVSVEIVTHVPPTPPIGHSLTSEANLFPARISPTRMINVSNACGPLCSRTKRLNGSLKVDQPVGIIWWRLDSATRKNCEWVVIFAKHCLTVMLSSPLKEVTVTRYELHDIVTKFYDLDAQAHIRRHSAWLVFKLLDAKTSGSNTITFTMLTL